MKRILALLLALFTLIPLASCASEINPPAYEEATATVTDTEAVETTPVVTPEKPAETEEVKKETEKIDENYNYPEVHDKLSWEKINAFPIANSNMSTDELRQLCVDFFRFTKTFAWTPSSTYKFQKNEKGSKDSIDKGSVYGGLPYVGLGSGSVYRVMDYYDTETGILMIQSAGEDRYLFGNQCSIGAYWGWGRVINSAKYRWTYDAVVANGFVRVGPYTYKDDLAKFDSFMNTVKVCKNNGRETMYESYAQLQPADGLVYYTSAGHIIMCSSKAHVVRNADGTINGTESYIYQIDQSQSWKEREQSNGDKFLVKTGVDTKRTFKDMYEDYYVPFTFKEFLGTDPVEDAKAEFSHTKETINPDELRGATLTTNYGISDVYIVAKDKDGNEVRRFPIRSKSAGKMLEEFEKSVVKSHWEPYADGEHTIEISVQLSNGTRPTVYTGTLVAE